MSAALENRGQLISGEEVPSAYRAQRTVLRRRSGDGPSAVGAAVALANRAIIERVGLLERASRIGARKLERLRSAASLAAVAEIRSSGRCSETSSSRTAMPAQSQLRPASWA